MKKLFASFGVLFLFIPIVLGQELPIQKNEKNDESTQRIAYANLLAGQRYLWQLKYSARDEAEQTRLAEQSESALKKAVIGDPKLSEGYTALAELTLIRPGGLVSDVLNYAVRAISINRDSITPHRYLALIYTTKSSLSKGEIDPEFAKKAVEQWKEVARIDQRNAEAWAFLSAFYEESGESLKRIDALEHWVASAVPLDSRFFSITMSQRSLLPESALPELGSAYFVAGKFDDALRTLTRAISGDPNDEVSLELMGRAIGSVDKGELAPAIETLQQAAYANSENSKIIELLAEAVARTGQFDKAINLLEKAVVKNTPSNKYMASKFQSTIGDIFVSSNRTDDAIAAYRKALEIRGIRENSAVSDDDKDFAVQVINKMVEALRKANRKSEAEKLLKELRPIFGNIGLEIDKSRIDLLSEIGKPQEALSLTQNVRKAFPSEIGLVRREATLLTTLDRVHEGASLIEGFLRAKPKGHHSMLYDDFSNYLFLATLYTTAREERQTFESIAKAFKSARNKESEQLAKLNLASAQEAFGRLDEAESNLRALLNETPRFPIALNNLGYLLVKQGRNLDEAVKLISRAIAIEPNNSSYLDSLGWAYFKMKRFDESEKYLRMAHHLNLTSPIILEHLGDLYLIKGDDNRARDAWKQALSLTSEGEVSKRLSEKLSR